MYYFLLFYSDSPGTPTCCLTDFHFLGVVKPIGRQGWVDLPKGVDEK